MLEVQLANRWGTHGTLGPNRTLRFEGATLKLGRKQQLAGEHLGEGWQIGDRLMTRLEIEGPLTAHFERDENASAHCGPFDFVLIVNDYVFAGASLLACYARDDGLWKSLDTGESWRTLVFTTVPIAM
jgi:hypothetical protein